MAISKVVYKSSPSATPVTWMDATTATAAAADIISPKTAMLANGVVTTGTGSGGGGTQEAEEKWVNFIDYDGTILYSYTAAEAQALSALPSNPSHTGLTAQGWNWTLAEIKSQLTAIPWSKVWVGQLYTTTSGKTEIDISLPRGLTKPYLSLGVNGTAVIDWGDNSSADTVTGSNLQTIISTQHIYSESGDYTISITVTSGSARLLGSNSDYHSCLHMNTGTTASNRAYGACIQHARIGTGMGIGANGFYYCVSLKDISMHNSMTFDMYAMFRYCSKLKRVVLPDGILSDYTFTACTSLETVSLPPYTSTQGMLGMNVFGTCYVLSGLTFDNKFGGSIGSSAFSANTRLEVVVIPSNTTSIATNAFNECRGVKEFHVLATSVPTLSNVNAFNTVASGEQIIYVPYSSDHSILSAYKSASNWSTYAAYIQEESP